MSCDILIISKLKETVWENTHSGHIHTYIHTNLGTEVMAMRYFLLQNILGKLKTQFASLVQQYAIDKLDLNVYLCEFK